MDDSNQDFVVALKTKKVWKREAHVDYLVSVLKSQVQKRSLVQIL